MHSTGGAEPGAERIRNEAGRIRQLGEIAREFDLDAIRLRIGEVEYELVRREQPPAGVVVTQAAAAAAPAAPTPGTANATAPQAPPNVHRVTAPVVGVFYRSPAPGAAPFVEIGDRVAAGQALCILEAMKLMNEITADAGGVVVRILPENGDLVALGDDLIWLEP